MGKNCSIAIIQTRRGGKQDYLEVFLGALQVSCVIENQIFHYRVHDHKDLSFSGALTTPIDVLKTRIMTDTSNHSVFQITSNIIRHEGLSSFLSGLSPRVFWLSIGGFVYLGTYQFALQKFESSFY